MSYRPIMWLLLAVITAVLAVIADSYYPQFSKALYSLIIVFFAAWIASVNFQNNEKMKREMTQIEALNTFIVALNQRLNYLLLLKQYYVPVFTKRATYSRAILLPVTLHGSIEEKANIGKVIFLTKLLEGLDEDDIRASSEEFKICNPAYLTAIIDNFSSICSQWEVRNKELLDIHDRINSGYEGKGKKEMNAAEIAKVISFSEMSRFLDLSEGVIFNIENAIKELWLASTSLAEEAKVLFSSKMLNEAGGLLTVYLSEEILELKDLEIPRLTQIELDKLHGDDYPLDGEN